MTLISSPHHRHSGGSAQQGSVLEAAALGVMTIRDTGVLDDDATFDIAVEIRTTTRHQIAWQRVQEWLDSSSRSPKEKLLKEGLR
jgi:hypothetical protein